MKHVLLSLTVLSCLSSEAYAQKIPKGYLDRTTEKQVRYDTGGVAAQEFIKDVGHAADSSLRFLSTFVDTVQVGFQNKSNDLYFNNGANINFQISGGLFTISDYARDCSVSGSNEAKDIKSKFIMREIGFNQYTECMKSLTGKANMLTYQLDIDLVNTAQSDLIKVNELILGAFKGTMQSETGFGNISIVELELRPEPNTTEQTLQIYKVKLVGADYSVKINLTESGALKLIIMAGFDYGVTKNGEIVDSKGNNELNSNFGLKAGLALKFKNFIAGYNVKADLNDTPDTISNVDLYNSIHNRTIHKLYAEYLFDKNGIDRVGVEYERINYVTNSSDNFRFYVRHQTW